MIKNSKHLPIEERRAMALALIDEWACGAIREAVTHGRPLTRFQAELFINKGAKRFGLNSRS